MREYDCTIVGDILWDVVVRTEYAQLTYGGTHYSSFAGIFPGGMGNVATALAYLGGRGGIIGKVGKDWRGRLYLEDLERNNISACVSYDNYLPTGLVVVFVDEKDERSFLVSRGASDNLLPEEMERAGLINNSSYLFVSGLSLVNSLQHQVILKAAEIARRNEVRIILDPGAHNLIVSQAKAFTELLGLSDILCTNLDEAKAITGMAEVEEIISQLRSRFQLMALKLGSESCILADNRKVIKLAEHKVKCVDTTGAGDAFAAVLIYGLSQGSSLEKTGKLANWFAAQVVKGYGARNLPTKAHIRRFLTGELTSG